jgi:DNA-directed RNA polymerase specialized sigma24 family protein
MKSKDIDFEALKIKCMKLLVAVDKKNGGSQYESYYEDIVQDSLEYVFKNADKFEDQSHAHANGILCTKHSLWNMYRGTAKQYRNVKMEQGCSSIHIPKTMFST